MSPSDRQPTVESDTDDEDTKPSTKNSIPASKAPHSTGDNRTLDDMFEEIRAFSNVLKKMTGGNGVPKQGPAVNGRELDRVEALVEMIATREPDEDKSTGPTAGSSSKNDRPGT